MNKIMFLIIAIVGLTESLFSGVVDDYSLACTKGDSKSCYQLGISYRDGLGVVQSAVAASQFFNMACDMKNSQACSELKETGRQKGHQKNTEIKVDYKKSCIDESAEECFKIGLSYYEGSEVEQNYKTAKEYLEIACDYKMGVGCGTLGVMYENGKGVKQDYAKAKAYYKTGCGYGYINGCLMVGIYWESGRGGEQNIAKANKYYRISKVYHEKECDNGDGNGCLMLGYLYSRGNGVSKDLQKAKEYYQKACNFGNTLGCKQVAESKK